MELFKLLKADHEKVADLLKKLDHTTERAVKTRTDLFEKLNGELGAHAYAEEKVLYPVVKDIAQTREIGFEAIEEHKIMKTLLSELATLSPEAEEWGAKLSVLKENVEHHVEEEEDELFPKLAREISPEDSETLAARIEEAKESFKKAEANPVA